MKPKISVFKELFDTQLELCSKVSDITRNMSNFEMHCYKCMDVKTTVDIVF